MDDQVTQLKAGLVNLFTKFTDAMANPKPNYSIAGQSVQYGDYLNMLSQAIRAALDLLQMVEPFELRSQVL